jgi:histidinol-phosphate/aromatic aminotransferase/cobyric acid decarboxylase-like protein
MDLQLYRDALKQNYAQLDNNPPSRKHLLYLKREGFTVQDVVDYYGWSEDVRGTIGTAYARERMLRIHQRVVERRYMPEPIG